MNNRSLNSGRLIASGSVFVAFLTLPCVIVHADSSNNSIAGGAHFPVAQASGNAGGYPPLGFNPAKPDQPSAPNDAAAWPSAPPPETMPLGPYAPIPQKQKAEA
ncbi:MAG: hypothetical protein ACK5KM_13950, partial [Hyphomicrobiaceae bacterium]